MSADASADGAPLLELRDVSAAYGPFRSLFDVSFDVHQGRVLAILGSNGAGKTTVARVCSGLIRASSGTVRFDGIDVTKQRPYRLARMGVAHAPEGRSVFASLTVEENLTLTLRRELGKSGVSGGLNRAYELFPRLGERRRQVAGTLSGGEQRMLALARVLVHPPRLLICDELSLGLAPIVVDEVYRTLATIRDTGTTLIIIEQLVKHALSIADDVVVLTKGRVSYRGDASEVDQLMAYLLPGGVEPSPNGRGDESSAREQP
jgi:branched-chain amino acid transport system ATP-binding protein